MTELEFKQWIFDPMRLELSPQALLLLLYIKMQCRQRYVFSAESMTKAMRFKDIRTMRRYKAELLDKGLIRQERCQYGLRITIPALDGSDSTYHAPSENSDSTFCADQMVHSVQSDSTYHAPSENSDSTFCADQMVHSVQSDSTFHAPSDSTFHAPLSIYKVIYKGTNKGDSSKNELEQKSQSEVFSSPRDNSFLKGKARYKVLEDVSEMDTDTQKALREMMKKFS